MIAVKEPAKRVTTYSLEGKENGFLTELFKDSEKTVFYLSCVRKNDFKGFHLHRVRAARYICVKGKIKIILYKNKKREEHILDSEKPERIFIPWTPRTAWRFLPGCASLFPTRTNWC